MGRSGLFGTGLIRYIFFGRDTSITFAFTHNEIVSGNVLKFGALKLQLT